MWEFMNANSFGVFVAFLFSMWMICKLVETWIDRNRPTVQCDCECDCCELDDEDDEDETT